MTSKLFSSSDLGNRESTSGGRREDQKEEEREARRRCRASPRWHPQLRPGAPPGPLAFRWARRKRAAALDRRGSP